MKFFSTFLLLSFFVQGFITSQTLNIEYEHSLNLGDKAKSLPADFVKSLNNTVIVFNYCFTGNISKYTYLQERARNPAIPRLNASGGIPVTTYKDFSTNFIYQDAKQIPNSVSKESLKIDQQWKIQKDTCTISNNKCKKATKTDNLNHIITAWYAPNIPVSDGPDEYYGLPGLILRVEIEGFVIEAVKVEINVVKEAKTVIQIPQADKYLTRNEFDVLVKKRQ